MKAKPETDDRRQQGKPSGWRFFPALLGISLIVGGCGLIWGPKEAGIAMLVLGIMTVIAIGAQDDEEKDDDQVATAAGYMLEALDDIAEMIGRGADHNQYALLRARTTIAEAEAAGIKRPDREEED